ncbi:MAG: alpha/beta fold hydrolase [Candidatus Hydrogenedentes bacterium]|nr:alpha/beta fold hydrolase [Candidatus Hydrogenedentota bacterium]
MLARCLVLVYCAEALAWTGLCAACLRAGLSVPAVVLIIALAILGLRLVIVAFMFAVAWRYRSPWPDTLPRVKGAWWRLFLREYLILIALYSGYMLFERLLRTRLSDRPHTQGPLPVIFVHGFFCNSGYWWSLIRFLRARDHHNLFTLNLDPVHGSIDQFAGQLAARVDEILEATGQDKVILVGHSMGGLVARAYCRRFGGTMRVRGIITLGSPHSGTVHARFSRARGAMDMRVGSQWLLDLSGIEAMSEAVVIPVTSIYTVHDNIVSPQASAVLVNARNIALAGMGHLSLAWDRTVQELVARELEAARSGWLQNSDSAEAPCTSPLIAPIRESMAS